MTALSTNVQHGDSAGVEQPVLDVEVLAGIVLCHALALLALLPAFFSWTGVLLLVLGIYLFGVVGIGVGFHRLITHRGFSCSAWLENTLAILGTCSLQYSPAYWVAVHRRHHHFSDEEKDPHSPLKGFFRSHLGWMIRPTADMKHGPMIDRYARDVMRKPLFRWLDGNRNWIKVALLSWVILFAAAFAGALVAGSSPSESLWFGGGVLLWGGPLRVVVVWQTTWSVNSVSHIWGYRNYDTEDTSRNNALVALLSGGEGWHNNHHADPVSARHGHKWWEFDLAWQTIRLLALLGIVTQVAPPSPRPGRHADAHFAAR